jgi:eukaryotic-like serine/threonine-protein kinase
MEPGSKFTHYTILSNIGKGGMGEVWKAQDTRLRREVAIKSLPEKFAQDEDRLARFEREARTLAALNHPNIAAIYGLERSGGTTALVMELVEGPTLEDRIAEGPIAIHEALQIGKQIADALEAAHNKGIIHRDLKPANIKVGSNGRVKLLDFGLAKAIESETDNDVATTLGGETVVGAILGTPAYMSPEQARGTRVDHQTDVWAFGCVLYEMLTRRRTFSGASVSETLAAVLGRDPDWSLLPPGLSSSIRVLLRRCLMRDPHQRLSRISTVLFVLEEEHALSVETDPTMPAPYRIGRRIDTSTRNAHPIRWPVVWLD